MNKVYGALAAAGLALGIGCATAQERPLQQSQAQAAGVAQQEDRYGYDAESAPTLEEIAKENARDLSLMILSAGDLEENYTSLKIEADSGTIDLYLEKDRRTLSCYIYDPKNGGTVFIDKGIDGKIDHFVGWVASSEEKDPKIIFVFTGEEHFHSYIKSKIKAGNIYVHRLGPEYRDELQEGYSRLVLASLRASVNRYLY